MNKFSSLVIPFAAMLFFGSCAKKHSDLYHANDPASVFKNDINKTVSEPGNSKPSARPKDLQPGTDPVQKAENAIIPARLQVAANEFLFYRGIIDQHELEKSRLDLQLIQAVLGRAKTKPVKDTSDVVTKPD